MTETVTGSEKAEALWARLKKEYGNGLTNMAEVCSEDLKVHSISPRLDMITGGIEEGSVVGIVGKPDTGKTTLAYHIAKRCQKDGCDVFYHPIENNFARKNTAQIAELKLAGVKVVRSTEDRFYTPKEQLEIARAEIQDVPRAVVIIDSISALRTDTEHESPLGAETRGGYAKMLSQFLDIVCGYIPVNKTILIGISHIIANTSGYGSPNKEKSPIRWTHALQYHLQAKKATPWMSGNDQIGLVTDWFCSTNCRGRPPASIESYFRFGLGIDTLYEAIMTASDMGIIEKRGTWYSYADVKVQGGEKLYQAFVDNPKLQEQLLTELAKANLC